LFGCWSRTIVTPDWLVPQLSEWSPIVGQRRWTVEDDQGDRKLLEAAQHLDRWLRAYTIAQDDFVNDALPDEFEAVVQALPEVIEYLQDHRREPRKGGPPDGRSRLCAIVCGGLWRCLYGEINPHSPRLWQACEAYWLACGNPPKVDKRGRYEDWLRYLLWAKETDDPDDPLITTQK